MRSVAFFIKPTEILLSGAGLEYNYNYAINCIIITSHGSTVRLGTFKLLILADNIHHH